MDRETLKMEVKENLVRKNRADEMIRKINQEKHKWAVYIRLLTEKDSTLSGDIVLAAGYITLLSAFPQKYRQKCLKEWGKQLTELQFYTNKEFNMAELFGDTAVMRRWHENSLPTDQMSINNAIVAEKSREFCLFIDTEYQGITWLK